MEVSKTNVHQDYFDWRAGVRFLDSISLRFMRSPGSEDCAHDRDAAAPVPIALSAWRDHSYAGRQS